MPPQSDLILNPICSATEPNEVEPEPTCDFPQTMELDSDFPPESFRVPKEEELDWFSRNAFMERKGSTKISCSGNLNSNSISTPRRSFHSFRNSPSQILILNSKSKSSIIGFPKSQKSCFADGNLRRSFKPEKAGLFRSRSEPGSKQVSEPGSPMVSCIGRVRSKKGREKRKGLWASLRAIFRIGLGSNRVVVTEAVGEANELGVGPAGSPFERFASGEGSELWGGGNGVDGGGKVTVHVDKAANEGPQNVS